MAPTTTSAEGERLVGAAAALRHTDPPASPPSAEQAPEAPGPAPSVPQPPSANTPQTAATPPSGGGERIQWKRWMLSGVALMVVIGVIAGGSEESSEDTAGGEPAAAAASDEAEETPELELTMTPRDGATVKGSEAVLKGRLNADGATVRIKGETVKVDGKRFTTTVPLTFGKNGMTIAARHRDYENDTISYSLTRKRTAAELAELREQRRIEAEQEKQAFMASATTIPYNQLEKNPLAHTGKRVKYYGEIFQIQEGYGGGLMLLSVTDLGYDIWDDNVWVNYDGSVQGAEGDMLTVYGTVKGSKSYDTQIGGETYVPKVKAKYVVE